ncbi:uncharacterized protein LOC5500375 isoform X1 [Nematostella vectensis]|uniref:uncharacterized protein LOC5500375 isoform X1 n=1 Tax=Nematostella vectensis TaxID=45351 RepID=UPI00207786CA|nr:uncharacterized protein LOC5500375 isoform X1 [Nematostella vectensis]
MMCLIKGFVFWCCVSLVILGSSSANESASKTKAKQCSPFSAELAKLCGYNATAKFKYNEHYSMASRAIDAITKLLVGCSPYANELICSVYLPRCEEGFDGPSLLCRRVCDEVFNKCGDLIARHGLEWIIGMCQLLSWQDNPEGKHYLERCYEPDGFNTSIRVEDESNKLQCHPLDIPICQQLGYNKTVLSVTKQQAYKNYFTKELRKFEAENNTDCRIMRKRLFCTESFTGCVNNRPAFFCRDKCHEFFKKNCTSIFFYDSSMCMEFPQGNSDVDICEQVDWPRAANWPIVNKVPGTGVNTPSSKTDITTASPSSNSPASPSSNTPDSQGPPGVYGRRNDADSSSGNVTAGVVGGVIAGLCLVIFAIGLAYYLHKRKKRREGFPYDKQILYSDDGVDIDDPAIET